MRTSVGLRVRHGRWSPALAWATARTVLRAVWVEAALRRVPLDRLAPRLGVRLAAETDGRPAPDGPEPEVSPPPPLSLREARDCRAVDRVVGRWPGTRGPCLRGALLYGHALRARTPLLHLGAGSVDGRLLGHAWLSYDGATLGRRADVLELTTHGGAR